MQKIKDKSVQGSVDVVIFGGNPALYEESIKSLADICKSNFDFEPVILTGPNRIGGYDGFTSVFLDTQNRRLYLTRPEQPDYKTNGSYLPSRYGVEKEKWDLGPKEN